MSALTIGSLFSGIGGLELGLERGIGNGAHTIWQVEQSEYCRAVLAKHWPDALRYDDVRTVGRSTLAPVDVLCGGFPCQDISTAGAGAGLSGERSGLWFEYLRIIRELRPRYVVVENVRALLVRGVGTVLGALADSGYDAEWSCIQAADVGAPHKRDRLFLLAYPADSLRRTLGRGVGRSKGTSESEARTGGIWEGDRRTGDDGFAASGSSLADANGVREPQPQGREPNVGRWIGDGGETVGHTVRSGLQERSALGRIPNQAGGGEPWSELAGACWWTVEPGVGRMAHGVPSRVDRLRALGNAVVPQVAEVVGRLIAEREAAERVA